MSTRRKAAIAVLASACVATFLIWRASFDLASFDPAGSFTARLVKRLSVAADTGDAIDWSEFVGAEWSEIAVIGCYDMPILRGRKLGIGRWWLLPASLFGSAHEGYTMLVFLDGDGSCVGYLELDIEGKNHVTADVAVGRHYGRNDSFWRARWAEYGIPPFVITKRPRVYVER